VAPLSIVIEPVFEELLELSLRRRTRAFFVKKENNGAWPPYPKTRPKGPRARSWRDDPPRLDFFRPAPLASIPPAPALEDCRTPVSVTPMNRSGLASSGSCPGPPGRCPLFDPVSDSAIVRGGREQPAGLPLLQFTWSELSIAARHVIARFEI